MKKAIFYLLVFTFTLTSCNKNEKNKFYRKVVFENQEWQRFDKLIYKIPVTPKDTLDFKMILTYNPKKFNLKVYPINITFYTLNNEVRSRDYKYRIFDFTKGKWKGEKIGDSLRIELPIKKEMTFNKRGNIKVEIENKNYKTFTPGVISLEFMVNKSKTLKP